MKNHFCRTVSLLVLAGVGAFTGCSTPAKTAESRAEDEYVYVTVTGSNIPKKIKKSDILAGKVPKDVQSQLVDKDEFQKSLRPGTAKGN